MKKNFSILVVDDESTIREVLTRYLENEGFRVREAADGYACLDAIAIEEPDLILLDIMMPKMSGFEVCKRIKNDPKTADVPVIMVTALSEYGDIERAIDSGTDDFISKPVNKLELLTRVRTMLKLKHLTDKLERTLAYLDEIEKQAQKAKAAS